MNALDLARSISPVVPEFGSMHYWLPTTLSKGKALGLSGVHFYFIGRGGVLGDVEPELVASAFGYFNPAYVKKMWNSARAKLPPPAAARLYRECSAEFARQRLTSVSGLESFCEAAEQVVAAANPAGMPLFAATAAQVLPPDPPARALQLATTFREMRGGFHLIAVLAAGLKPQEAHYLRNPDRYEKFGWTDVPVLTDDHRARLAEADLNTDRLLAEVYSVLDDKSGAELLDGVTSMRTALVEGGQS